MPRIWDTHGSSHFTRPRAAAAYPRSPGIPPRAGGKATIPGVFSHPTGFRCGQDAFDRADRLWIERCILACSHCGTAATALAGADDRQA